MYYKEFAVEVRNLSKCYEIYKTPRHRLKQFILPRLHQTLNKVGNTLGISNNSQKPFYYNEFWALKDVSFKVRRGETFGIIGRNGSGKSTLLQIIAGTLAQTGGEVSVNGRIAALLELGSGFNPDFTGRQNIFLNGYVLGLTQREIESRYDQIIAFADIGEFIQQPVKTYSSGMFLRLAFAVQAHIDASIVIIDEALAVGDVFFRQKCYTRMEELKNSGAAIFLVSHSMTEVEQFCDRAILLDHGKQKYLGPAVDATKHYYLLQQPDGDAHSTASDDESPDPQNLCKSDNPSTFWPPKAIIQDALNHPQVKNGSAECLRYTVCDEKGVTRNHFEQGETAYFFFEFLLSKPIAVPLAGIVLQNERGVNVHGKSSLEYGAGAPDFLPEGSLIRCRQQIDLILEIGEYSYELGLAAIDVNSYKAMSTFTYEQLNTHITRICHLPRAGVISVGWRSDWKTTQLTHHGVADLPGKFDFEFENSIPE